MEDALFDSRHSGEEMRNYGAMFFGARTSRKEKPSRTPRKLFDGGGMYLLLSPDGTRWWRFKYRIAGREKLLSPACTQSDFKARP